MQAKGSVLVVDDDTDIRDALSSTLADEGYTAVEAPSGQAALDYLRANPAPSLILLDWNMPQMNGPQFMAEAAKVPAICQIPVVLLTADARAPQKAELPGFVGFLMKPVSLDDLFALVGRYCG